MEQLKEISEFGNFQEDIGLLTELALIAIKHGDEESAVSLLDAVRQIDPNNISVSMGFGLIALHKMDIAKANICFQQVVDQDATNWRAMAFLGFSNFLHVFKETDPELKKQLLTKSHDLANLVVQNSEEVSTKELAQSVLNLQKSLQDKAAGLSVNS